MSIVLPKQIYSNDETYNNWTPYDAYAIKNRSVEQMDNGSYREWLRIESVRGTYAGRTFGLRTESYFPTKAGQSYKLTFLYACHSNANITMDYVYILTIGNTSAPHYRIAIDMATVETFDHYATLTTGFSLPVYRYNVTFVAQYDDDRSRLLLGSKVSKDLPDTNYGLIFVSDVILENLSEEKVVFSDSLKTNWTPDDYYNFEDLDRVEQATKHVNKMVASYKGNELNLDFVPNRVPYPNTLENYLNWYNNLEFTPFTFPSGREGFKAKMIDFATNPRMRIVGSAATDSLTSVEEGKTYKYSVVFEPFIKLERIEFMSLYYYQDVDAVFWQDFSAIDVSALEVESEKDNTLIYEVTFVAQATARVRPSFGFGLGNTLMDNGVWVNIAEFRIEEARSEKHIELAYGLNRIENNIALLKQNFPAVLGLDEMKTDWISNTPFDFNDANRLERNLVTMHDYIIANQANVPHCGQYIVGQEGVL